MKTNIKPATIARIGALLVVLANQCLVMFGQDVLPFTENMAYQVVSLVAVIVVATVNAWYNNDISKLARLCGDVFDALSDGKITEEEIEEILSKVEQEPEETENTNWIVNFVNKAIVAFKKNLKQE